MTTIFVKVGLEPTPETCIENITQIMTDASWNWGVMNDPLLQSFAESCNYQMLKEET
jgi:hypothetical protein